MMAAGSLDAEIALLRVASDRHASAVERVHSALARDLFLARPIAPAIVVLEDHDGVRDGACKALRHAFPGVEVIPCATTTEARVALYRRPAVILSDYYLGSGETSRHVLAHRDPAVRAILYSGAVDVGALSTVGEDVGAVVCARPTTGEAWDCVVDHVRRALDESGAMRRASR